MTTLKLVFLVSLTVAALCFSLSDAREMPKEEVNCIGICPPNDPGCSCMPLATAPPPMDDVREMSKEAKVRPPPCYVTPPPPPMDDTEKMSNEAMEWPTPCYATPPPPPMDDAREMSEEAMSPPCYVSPPPPMDDAREMSKETTMPPPCYVSPPPPMM